MSYADYLAAERGSDVKHEYLRGEVWAMAGGKPEHSRLAMRMGVVLTRLLEGKPCGVFGSDARIRIEETDLATYPDVSVVCGKLTPAGDDEDAIRNPLLIVEVLSDSTEAYDRGEKWAHYQRIESLQAYALVSQHEPRIELYNRKSDGQWLYTQATQGQSLRIEALEATLDVDEVYRNPLGS